MFLFNLTATLKSDRDMPAKIAELLEIGDENFPIFKYFDRIERARRFCDEKNKDPDFDFDLSVVGPVSDGVLDNLDDSYLIQNILHIEVYDHAGVK